MVNKYSNGKIPLADGNVKLKPSRHHDSAGGCFAYHNSMELILLICFLGRNFLHNSHKHIKTIATRYMTATTIIIPIAIKMIIHKTLKVDLIVGGVKVRGLFAKYHSSSTVSTSIAKKLILLYYNPIWHKTKSSSQEQW